MSTMEKTSLLPKSPAQNYMPEQGVFSTGTFVSFGVLGYRIVEAFTTGNSSGNWWSIGMSTGALALSIFGWTRAVHHNKVQTTPLETIQIEPVETKETTLFTDLKSIDKALDLLANQIGIKNDQLFSIEGTEQEKLLKKIQSIGEKCKTLNQPLSETVDAINQKSEMSSQELSSFNEMKKLTDNTYQMQKKLNDALEEIKLLGEEKQLLQEEVSQYETINQRLNELIKEMLSKGETSPYYEQLSKLRDQSSGVSSRNSSRSSSRSSSAATTPVKVKPKDN